MSMVPVKHYRHHATTSSTARGGLMARQMTTEYKKGRAAVDSPPQKLDTPSVDKVSHILVAVHKLTSK